MYWKKVKCAKVRKGDEKGVKGWGGMLEGIRRPQWCSCFIGL